MAAYYLALAYYALGPDRLAARFVPHLRRMRSGASTAAIAAGSAAGVAVEWVKGINWVSCCCDWLGVCHAMRHTGCGLPATHMAACLTRHLPVCMPPTQSLLPGCTIQQLCIPPAAPLPATVA